MPGSTAIVVTTIFEPRFLGGYLDNLRRHGHDAGTTVWVVPDRKTPPSVAEAAEAARRDGFDVRCPDLEEQVAFLRRLALPDDFVPWNSDNRRNVGFLMALDAGCEVLISIDDDNFCRSDTDFVGEHLAVGRPAAEETATSDDGWFNTCSLLESDCAVEIFPRGFPYFARRRRRSVTIARNDDERIVAVNAGLWLDDPDVDAVSRLALAPRTTALARPSVVLGRGVRSPLNTQNTALTRSAAAAYYYVRMGHPLAGLTIDRYGDILSGYFLQACMDHLNEAVRVGTPVADHVRTPHDLLKDLYHELAGIMLIEDLLPWLAEQPLDGTSYIEAYASLADGLASAAARFAGFLWDRGGREFLAATAERMRTWCSALKRIGV